MKLLYLEQSATAIEKSIFAKLPWFNFIFGRLIRSRRRKFCHAVLCMHVAALEFLFGNYLSEKCVACFYHVRIRH